MNNWLSVDTKLLNSPRKKDVHGVQIEVMFSPFNLPQAVRGYYDKMQERFIVEFRYIICDEDLVDGPSHKNSFLKVKVGKNSKRVYQILVDVRSQQFNAIGLAVGVKTYQAVNQAIDELASSNESCREYYDLTKNVIAARQSELFKMVTTTHNNK